MINNSEFSKRLKIIMDYYQISAASFADKIGVQRSSISHLLSGRNKPSLDFVLKVVRVFEEVELYWLLNGKGDFPGTSPAEADTLKSSSAVTLKKNTDMDTVVEEQTVAEGRKTLERIVFFYTDGTFKEYLK